MGAIGTLGCFDPGGNSVESEAGNLTTPGPIDLHATLAALFDRAAHGAAMEVSSHSLDQGRIEGLVFRAALFTNLTRDHLDYHETFDAYFAAKAKLIGYLASDGLSLLNADDAAWSKLPPAPRRISFSALGAPADVTGRNVRVDAKGARFTLVTNAGSHDVAPPPPRCRCSAASTWRTRWASPRAPPVSTFPRARWPSDCRRRRKSRDGWSASPSIRASSCATTRIRRTRWGARWKRCAT